MDLNTPELLHIFREEMEERTGRLVAGGRALADGTLDRDTVEDLIRDAHTLKGSAGLLGLEMIREVAFRLEKLWRLVSEGQSPQPEVVVAMEASAGRMVASLDSQDDSELAELVVRLDSGLEHTVEAPEVVRLQRQESGSLGGLLSSVSDTLMGGATRVDTSELYRLINRIVEVTLDAEALADLSLVSIEGADPNVFRKSWRAQLQKLSSAINDIQAQAVGLANVTFSEATATFPQFVRYIGRRLGKDVRFELVGDDVHLDRQIVDLLREPLRHLLVNAVDHGIEPADTRAAAGKPPTGTVKIGAEVIDEGIDVWVSDDGAGIDWDRVAEAAHDQGIPVIPPDLKPVLFEMGFTTSPDRSDFSGTGEGLPTVQEAVERVSGAVRIETESGKGTTVILTLPLSIVLQNVVVVASGDAFWGLPEASVEATMPLAQAEIINADGREIRFQSAAIPCISLAEAVGAPPLADESELLVVSTRFGLVGVTVSELIDRRRVAVKGLGPILENAHHVTGAALVGGDQVLVVLDPNFLGMVARNRPRLAERKPRVLVVDDSAGARQLLAATLNGAGFEVEVASSARQALMAMASDGFDAMVVDYSMPRSNGVELVRAMRAADVSAPIVMVSGVATQEEKRAAWEVGVDAYLDKFDLRHGVLTQTLRQLIERREVANG